MPRNARLLLCRAFFGALAAIPVGYFLFGIGIGSEGAGAIYWFLIRGHFVGWAVYGAVMGMLWHAISRLNENSN